MVYQSTKSDIVVQVKHINLAQVGAGGEEGFLLASTCSWSSPLTSDIHLRRMVEKQFEPQRGGPLKVVMVMERVIARKMAVFLEFTKDPGSQVVDVQGALNGRVV